MTTDINLYLNRLDILNETALQIIKDFGISGLEIKFSGNTNEAYGELFAQIRPYIEKLVSGNTEAFYNLLYRIDISENQIREASRNTLDKSFSEIITGLIIKRELQKVITRKHFSS